MLRLLFFIDGHGNDPHGAVIAPGVGIGILYVCEIEAVHMVAAGAPAFVFRGFPGIEDILGLLASQPGFPPGDDIAPVHGDHQTNTLVAAIAHTDAVAFTIPGRNIAALRPASVIHGIFPELSPVIGYHLNIDLVIQSRLGGNRWNQHQQGNKRQNVSDCLHGVSSIGIEHAYRVDASA